MSFAQFIPVTADPFGTALCVEPNSQRGHQYIVDATDGRVVARVRSRATGQTFSALLSSRAKQWVGLDLDGTVRLLDWSRDPIAPVKIATATATESLCDVGVPNCAGLVSRSKGLRLVQSPSSMTEDQSLSQVISVQVCDPSEGLVAAIRSGQAVYLPEGLRNPKNTIQLDPIASQCMKTLRLRDRLFVVSMTGAIAVLDLNTGMCVARRTDVWAYDLCYSINHDLLVCLGSDQSQRGTSRVFTLSPSLTDLHLRTVAFDGGREFAFGMCLASGEMIAFETGELLRTKDWKLKKIQVESAVNDAP